MGENFEVYIQDGNGEKVADLLIDVERYVAAEVCLTLNEHGLLRPGYEAHFVSVDD